MNYISEKISKSDVEKILTDARNCTDPLILKIFQSKGGHFINHPPQRWSLDKENDSYLFFGPQLLNRDFEYYTFFFKKEFYRIRLKVPLGEQVTFDNLTNGHENPQLKIAIYEAFCIYGRYGNDGTELDRPIEVKFIEGEGK